MNTRRNKRQTELFLVRVWLRPTEGGKVPRSATEWRGKVQRVVDGEAHEFDDWQGLLAGLVAMLPGSPQDDLTLSSRDEE